MRAVSALALLLALCACAPPPADWEPALRTANDELLNKGNAAYARDAFAASYVGHSGGGEVRGGPELIEGFVAELRKAFPDLRTEIQILAKDGDRITWLRTHRGTHQADFMGVPASGRTITWETMIVTRFEDGKVAEEWGVSDLGEKLRVP